MHGTIDTNRYRAHQDSGLGEVCISCFQTETLEHLFVLCPFLFVLSEVLRKEMVEKRWFHGVREDFSFTLFVFSTN